MRVLKRAPASGKRDPYISFSGSIAEGATTGRAVGTATLANPPVDIGTLTWSELGTGTGAALFAIDGSTGAVTNTAALDYETATSYTYGIQVTDGVYTYTLLATISVTNVLEVTLSALTLSSSTATLNASTTITLTGESAGSTFSIVSGALPTGMSINASTGDITGTPTVEAAYNFTVRETNVDGSNSPRDSALSITVTNITAAALWTPSQLSTSDLKLWYDFSDAANRTVVSGEITALTDKSTSGKNLTAQSTHEPTYHDLYMSREAGAFDVTGGTRLRSSTSFTLAQPFTVYAAIFPFASLGGSQGLLETDGAILRTSHGTTPLFYSRSGTVATMPTALSNKAQVLRARAPNTGTGYISTDADTEMSATMGSTGGFSGTISLGDATTDNDAKYGGFIGEMLVMGTDVTPDGTTDDNITGALAWKWGTWRNLQTSHPYRYAAPLASGAAPAVPSFTRALFLAHGASTSDYHYANIFDPNVVEHPTDPTKLALFASGQGDDTGNPGGGYSRIGRWTMTKASPLATPTFDQVVLTGGTGPAWNNQSGGVRLGTVIYTGGTYYMYFTTQLTGTAIGVATSTDGVTFTINSTQMLTPSGDETQIGEPAVWWEDGVATMIYDYRTSADVLPGLRVATASSLTGPFTKTGGTDILKRPSGSGDPGTNYDMHVEYHQIVKRNGKYYMLVEVGGNVTDTTPYRNYLVGPADSPAGPYQWNKLVIAENPSGTTGVDDKFHVATPGLFTVSGTDYLLWTGAPDKAQPYGENHWNLYGSAITGIFDTV